MNLYIFFNSILLIIFFHNVNLYVQRKLKINYSFELFNIFILSTLLIIVSVFFQIILLINHKFFNENYELIKYFFQFLLVTNLIFFIKHLLNKKIEYSNYLNKSFLKKYWYVLLINIIFFISSFGIANDADSLIYHLSISKNIISGFPVNFFMDNFHNKLFGSMEIFNVLPELFGITHFNSLLNSYFLINFSIFLFKRFPVELYNTKLYFLLFISAPVITGILYTQKVFFIPIVIQILVLIIYLYSDKIKKYELFFSITSLIFSSSFKLNFIVSAVLIYLIFFFKNNANLKSYIKISFIAFLIFILPQLIFKTYLFENPFPILWDKFFNLTNESSNFGKMIEGWKINDSSPFPLNLFIYHNLLNMNNSLGFGLLVLFFIKKIKFSTNTKLILFLSIFLFFSNFYIQQTSRFYFLVYAIICLLIIKSDIYFEKIIKKLVFAQYAISCTILFIFLLLTISTSFLEKKSEKYLENFIFRYKFHKELEKTIGENKFIITDLPNYLSKNYIISTSFFSITNNSNELKKYAKFINSLPVEYLITVGEPLERKKFINFKNEISNNFLNKCFDELIKILNIERANRKNFLFKNKIENNYFVYKKKEGCLF